MSTWPWKSALLALGLLTSATLTGCPEPADPNHPDASTDAGGDAGDDAGTDPVETGGAASSAQLQAVRDAAVGPQAAPLEVADVAVTYVLAAQADDPAGFFVQAEQAGPALFIAVDPGSLDVELAVGDLVSFSVTETATVAEQHRVTGLSGLSRSHRDFDVGSLVQELGEVDVVGGLSQHESELSTLSLTVAAEPTACENGLGCVKVMSHGVNSGEGLWLRGPEALLLGRSLRVGCVVTSGPTPLWRYLAQAQASTWLESELSVDACPDVLALSANAVSSTQVEVQFNAALAPASVTPEAFTIDSTSGPLVVTAASVSGKTVVLTTEAQDGSTIYALEVAGSVKDVNGFALAPHGALDFTGFSQRARVVINEVHFAGSCDEIELRVLEGGTMTGFKISDAYLPGGFTFPAFTVQRNDLIVLHASGNGTCSAGALPAPELTAPDAVSHLHNHAGAFDFWVALASLHTQSTVLVRNDIGAIQDAVVHSTGFLNNANAKVQGFEAVAAGQWTGVTPIAADDVSALEASAVVHQGAGVNESVQRSSQADTQVKADWTLAAPTLGALNAGQTPLP